jgi:hypothetical protein
MMGIKLIWKQDMGMKSANTANMLPHSGTKSTLQQQFIGNATGIRQLNNLRDLRFSRRLL